MLRFTAMSCQRETGGRKIEGFASINVSINDLGFMKMQVTCYDAYQNSLSKFVSKLPVVRNMRNVTDFQNRMSLAISNIVDGGQLVVGFCKRDVSMFSQLVREFRNTGLNKSRLMLDINQPITELTGSIPKFMNVRSSYDVADYYSVDITLVKELACIVFDVDYYAELPDCAVRAALYCCIKLQNEGYDLEDVLTSCTEYMTSIESGNYVGEPTVKLSKRTVTV